MCFSFQFEKIQCPTLVMCGDDDAAVCNNHSHKMEELINNNGHHNQCELIVYQGAGHIIEPPHAPICTESYQPPLGNYRFVINGYLLFIVKHFRGFGASYLMHKVIISCFKSE